MSGRKSIIRPYKILNAVDVATDQYSAATNIEKVDEISLVFDWAAGLAGNPAGTISIEVQNGDSAWQTFTYGHKAGVLPTTSLTLAVSGASGSGYMVLKDCHFEKMRVFYDSTSGSGTLTATMVAKVLGA